MSDFKAKRTKIDFGPGSASHSAAGAYSAPRTLSWNKGNLLLSEGRGAGRGREEGREGKAGGGEGRTDGVEERVREGRGPRVYL